MPDLSEILKGAVDDVPEFDPVALVTRRRRQRRAQAVGATSVLVVIAAAIVVLLNTGSSGVVVSTRKPASESTDASTSSSSSETPTIPASDTVSSVTTIPPTATTGTTTTVPGSRPPQAGDFTGTLTVGPSTVHVGEAVSISLSIHNVSGAVVDTSANRIAVGLACFATGGSDQTWSDLAAMSGPALQPGGDATLTDNFPPNVNDVGSQTCEATIIQWPDGFDWPYPVARVTGVPTVTVTVLPGDTATTTTSTIASTTVPPPTS